MITRNRQRIQAHAAVDIQRYWRGWQLRESFGKEHWSATCIQKIWRGFGCRQWLVWNIDATKLIAATWRGYVLRKQMRLRRWAAVQIQKRWRGIHARRALASQQCSITCIQ
eukprot:COSAG02_NODE_48815_length_331_cov_0.767241_1_plen_110_part_11